eukprot:TRINITY_DN13705_c0_g1_i1.p1 TRINITY_DN13705_c0_g1~~TRINITY_DN13705_c0_g1_i1.p1  ORF type:complete len:287 (-),score=80.52 TRINITY_DN13705_c0_g1_i1:69-929(-)
MPLSLHEREFLTSSVAADCRPDGRRRFDARPLKLESGILNHTSGSAKLKLGGTEILAGVKVEVGAPLPSQPNRGHACVSVDCSPAATALDKHSSDELSSQVAALIERSLRNSGVDWEGMCLVPEKACWIFFVDILVLDSDGNLFDAASVASIAALHCTQIPEVTVSVDPSSGELQIEVDDDQSKHAKLDVSNAPVLVTVHSVAGWHMLDCTLQEEECSDAKLVVACAPNDDSVCGVHKGGDRGIKPSELLQMTKEAQGFGKVLLGALQEFMQQDQMNTPHGGNVFF